MKVRSFITVNGHVAEIVQKLMLLLSVSGQMLASVKSEASAWLQTRCSGGRHC